MKASHEAYARARQRLLDAQAELAAAHQGMQAAEGQVRDEVNAAMEANRQAIEFADVALTAAQHRLAEVEVDVGTSARARYLEAGGVGLVFLNEDEQGRVDVARAAVEAARQASVAAREVFKAGVTAEQLAAPASPSTDAEAPPP